MATHVVLIRGINVRNWNTVTKLHALACRSD